LKIIGDIAKKVQTHLTTLGRNERVIILSSLSHHSFDAAMLRFTIWPWNGRLYVSLKKNCYLRFYLFFLFLSECQTLNAFFSKLCFQNAYQKYLGNGWTDLLEIWRT